MSLPVSKPIAVTKNKLIKASSWVAKRLSSTVTAKGFVLEVAVGVVGVGRVGSGVVGVGVGLVAPSLSVGGNVGSGVGVGVGDGVVGVDGVGVGTAGVGVGTVASLASVATASVNTTNRCG